MYMQQYRRIEMLQTLEHPVCVCVTPAGLQTILPCPTPIRRMRKHSTAEHNERTIRRDSLCSTLGRSPGGQQSQARFLERLARCRAKMVLQCSGMVKTLNWTPENGSTPPWSSIFSHKWSGSHFVRCEGPRKALLRTSKTSQDVKKNL